MRMYMSKAVRCNPFNAWIDMHVRQCQEHEPGTHNSIPSQSRLASRHMYVSKAAHAFHHPLQASMVCRMSRNHCTDRLCLHNLTVMSNSKHCQ